MNELKQTAELLLISLAVTASHICNN